MRLPNPFRWLRTRNAAIASRRVDHAARTKGGLFAKDQTPDRTCDYCDQGLHFHDVGSQCLTGWCGCKAGPIRRDDLMAVADEVAEPLCRRRWDVDPAFTGHTVPHLCVMTIPEHKYHECACGVWRLEIGATP